jgi:hypothetical protein
MNSACMHAPPTAFLASGRERIWGGFLTVVDWGVVEETLDLTAVEVQGEHPVHPSGLTRVHGSVFEVCFFGVV